MPPPPLGPGRTLPLMAPNTASTRPDPRQASSPTDATTSPPAPFDESAARPTPRRGYGRWRAISLSLVYLIFAAHILHWKLTGRTLAPLELNEVMYTLELGVITAGFLFMCALVLGTLIFGRFFCSWACHIMVLQELCAWLLRKLGIRRKPVRSRLLLLVPPATAFYMFVLPQILRAWRSGSFPEFHFRSDAEGWSSFVTANFWRNLPSPPIIILTFLVCGFLIVYLLGSRTFCTYVCPYGAIFALADRFSPGRLRGSDKCRQCGTCTAACTSGVRVHEELKVHGVVASSACMKCLDCVSACPHDALHYGFAKPALFKSVRTGGRFGRLPYDFSIREELLMAGVFLLCACTFRGLYSRVPFLLSLALGGIVAYLTVTALRLATHPNVLLGSLTLRRQSRLTGSGRVYVAFAAMLALFVGHSAFVRYHEYTGLRAAMDLSQPGAAGDRDRVAADAIEHLRIADRWGLLTNERVLRSLVDLTSMLGEYESAESHARRLLERMPEDGLTRLHLGQALAAQGHIADAERELRTITHWSPDPSGATHIVAAAHEALGGLFAREGRFDAAGEELRRVVRLQPGAARAHAELGSILAEQGRLDEAVASLRRAVEIDAGLGMAHYNLGTLLLRTGRAGEALSHLERAAATMPPDSDLQNNLGLARLESGDASRARMHFEQALRFDPTNANAHFNLARWYTARGDAARAKRHFLAAAQLDRRYAEFAPP